MTQAAAVRRTNGAARPCSRAWRITHTAHTRPNVRADRWWVAAIAPMNTAGSSTGRGPTGAMRQRAAATKHAIPAAFGTLHRWLTDNLYRHGSKFTPNDLIKRATGEPMTMRPYLAYLRGKYGELYSLPAAA